MDMGVVILIKLIFGAITAAIAASKGRSTIGWFFGGFFLDLIGLIIVAALPNLNEQRQVFAQADAERRRLKEQLRQEKMKTEAFRRHATHRLDSHDGALGMDTRQTPGLAAGQGVRRPLGPGEQPAPGPPPIGEPTWYYEADGSSMGPVPQSTLVWMLETGAVTLETLVWTEGQADWLPARSIPAFRDAAPS